MKINGNYLNLEQSYLFTNILVTLLRNTMAVFGVLGGMLMLMMGLVGEYIGRMYISMNRSPQYVIREVIRHEEEQEAEN